MTDDQLTRKLAEKVMGWERHWIPSDTEVWLDSEGAWHTSFAPLTDMNDAMRLLEGYTVDTWVTELPMICWNPDGDGGWYCQLHTGVNVIANTPQRAVCYAVAKAHGIKYEKEIVNEND